MYTRKKIFHPNHKFFLTYVQKRRFKEINCTKATKFSVNLMVLIQNLRHSLHSLHMTKIPKPVCYQVGERTNRKKKCRWIRFCIHWCKGIPLAHLPSPQIVNDPKSLVINPRKQQSWHVGFSKSKAYVDVLLSLFEHCSWQNLFINLTLSLKRL